MLPEAETEVEDSEEDENGVDENIPSLDFLGTRRFFPVSAALFCPLPSFGTREGFATAAAFHESSNTRAKEAELVLELPPSEEEMAVEEGVAEIKRMDGIAPGAGAGAVACIALGVGCDEWNVCAECELVGWDADVVAEEANGMLKILVVVVVVVKSGCWR